MSLTRPQTRALIRLLVRAIAESPDPAKRSQWRRLLRKMPAGHGWRPHSRPWDEWMEAAGASEPRQEPVA